MFPSKSPLTSIRTSGKSSVLSTVFLVIFWPSSSALFFQPELNCSAPCTCRENTPENTMKQFMNKHASLMGAQYRTELTSDHARSEYMNFLGTFAPMLHRIAEIKCVLSDGLPHSIMSLVNGADKLMDVSLEVKCMSGEDLIWDIPSWQINLNIMASEHCSIVRSDESKQAIVPMNMWIVDIEKGGANILDLLDIRLTMNTVTLSVSGYRGRILPKQWADGNLVSSSVITLQDNNLDSFDCLLLTKKLDTLNLQSNQFTLIPDCIMSTYGKNLQYLNLAKNQISDISAIYELGSTQKQNDIRIINLSFNQIHKIEQIRSMGNLSVLDFSYNAINDIDEDAFLKLESLTHLYLAHNQIHTIGMSWFRGSFLLQTIDLSHNYMTTFGTQTFLNLTRTLTIHFQYNRMSFPPFKRCATVGGDEPIKVQAYAAGNPFICDCNLIDFENCPAEDNSIMRIPKVSLYLDHSEWTCHSPPANQNLKMADLFVKKHCIITKDCPAACNCVLLNVKTLVVNCSYRQLSDMPETIPTRADSTTTLHLDHNHLQILSYRPYLQFLSRLYAHNCQIQLVTSAAIQALLNVSVLTLHDNRLYKLPFKTNRLFRKHTNVTLHNNRWGCPDTLSWLPSCVASHRALVWAPGYLICNYMSWRHEETVDLDPRKNPLLEGDVLLSTILVGVAIFTIFIIILVYRSEIRIMIYQYLGVRLTHSFSHGDLFHPYDVFVVYSQDDYVWIVDALVPRLEGQQSYKLCLNYRDSPPQDSIVDNIPSAIRLSRCVLLLLTNKFLAKEWKIPEVRVIFQHLLLLTSRLIIVIAEDVHMSNVSVDLRVYMNTHDYILFGEANFWKKLDFYLPSPRHHEKELPSYDTPPQEPDRSGDGDTADTNATDLIEEVAGGDGTDRPTTY